jgi:phospholipase/lecithinase/hemolysin
MALMKRMFALVACVVMVLGMAQAAAAQQPSHIVVFGDSLSDPGNAFALLGSANTPPDYDLDPFLVPGAPYARGGHHFTNGATWVEQLARPLGLSGSVQPAFQLASPHATNFAVGGARARQIATGVNLPTQVQAYLQRAGGARADALYVIAVGGNDVRDALFAYAQGQDGGAVVGAALASTVQTIMTLHAAGARRFLIWNAPDIGRTPAIKRAGPGVAPFATLISQGYNANLAFLLGQLSSGLPGIQIVPFDAFALINEIAETPSTFGMTNVTSACLTPNVAPFACQQPNEYLFWDGIHPTVATHAIIAGRIGSLLGW